MFSRNRKTRVAINGFGRIGRAFFKLAFDRDDIDIVAVNDLGDVENMAYLLEYDTVYRTSPFRVSVRRGEMPSIVVGKKTTRYLSQKDPSLLPWRELDIDVVVESTGLFASYEKSRIHLSAGAKRVVITAPSKDDASDSATILLGVNEDRFAKTVITSNASCTTNAASPLIAILDGSIGIEKAILNTVHGYTASQSLVDSPNKKDWREGRAAGQNIVPSSTGAAIATTKAFTRLSGKFDGISIRVPVISGSIVDVTFVAKRNTTVDEVNEILRKASISDRWHSTFTVTDDPLVSSDIVGMPYASIADLAMTRVVDGNLVKVMAWYDNEMGYTHTLLSHVIKAGQRL